MTSLGSLLNRVGVYAGRLPRPFTIDAHLRDLLHSLCPTLVIDVGGHEGEYGLRLRALGYRGPIVSYEPLPASADILEHHAQRDGSWRVRRVALGASAAHSTLHVTSGTDMASLHRPNALGQQRFGASMEIVKEVVVPVTTLTAEWEALEPSGAVLLKMDTQGHDMAVLAGAMPVLRYIAAIQTEISVRGLYEGVPALPESLTWFTEQGYMMSGIFPLSRDHDGLTLLEVDAMFVRIRG